MVRDVVLLVLDTVRYDYFESHGEHLKTVADTSFEECRTASTWSVPSHASIFTEVLPNEHGFHSATPAFEELDREETFLANLEGFRFIGVSSNPYASPIFGFDGLYDDFYHVEGSIPYSEGLSPAKFWHQFPADNWTRYAEFLKACVRHEHPLKSVLNGAASQADKLFHTLPLKKPFDDGCKRVLSRTKQILTESDEPTLVFANIMDVHGPLTNVRGYDQSLISREHRNRSPDIDPLSMNMDDSFDDHEADIGAYRELYAAAVNYTCRRVAEFSNQVGDDTAVIITSDHGEQLAEDTSVRRFGHVTPDMTEDLLHVPLAVVNADLSVDESEPISHLDLGNLVTAIASESTFDKRKPIAAEVAGLGVAHPPNDHDEFDYWNRTSRCVYREGVGEKFVWNSCGDAWRYTRSNGSYMVEREGGLDIVPPECTRLFATDIEDVRTDEGEIDIDASVESQLEELGYL